MARAPQQGVGPFGDWGLPMDSDPMRLELLLVLLDQIDAEMTLAVAGVQAMDAAADDDEYTLPYPPGVIEAHLAVIAARIERARRFVERYLSAGWAA